MKFSPIVALVLGAVLAAAEAVQLQLGLSHSIHDGLTLAITVLSGVGVLAVSGSAIIALVPHQTLVVITALIGLLNVVQGSWSLSSTWHTILAVALVIGNTLFSSNGVPPAVHASQAPPADPASA